MASWAGVITNVGAELLNGWTEGSTLSIYAATAGTDTVSTASMAAATALANQKQTASIVGKSIADNTGGLKIQIQLTAPATSYTLNQIGVWAKLDNGAGKLLALYQNLSGISIPAASESPDFAYTFYGYLSISNSGSVSVTIDTSATATMSAVEAAIASAVTNLQPIIASTPPTASTAGAIGQAYIDTSSSSIWHCTAISSGVYTWEQMLNVLTGKSAPTVSTAGAIGQLYINTTSADTYICAATAEGVYTWLQLVTSSNISEQGVHEAFFASYAPDTNVVSVAALRNEKFVAKDEYTDDDAPEQAGEICWLYG